MAINFVVFAFWVLAGVALLSLMDAHKRGRRLQGAMRRASNRERPNAAAINLVSSIGRSFDTRGLPGLANRAHRNSRDIFATWETNPQSFETRRPVHSDDDGSHGTDCVPWAFEQNYLAVNSAQLSCNANRRAQSAIDSRCAIVTSSRKDNHAAQSAIGSASAALPPALDRKPQICN